ncbi:hypothetical protein ABZO31_25185 [Streptomyces sp. HUAS MG47]|uniref:hypothetical protein n=1 Tax=Streptomyces solicamelliae TaxID=3231716 RepID=UPI00387794AD
MNISGVLGPVLFVASGMAGARAAMAVDAAFRRRTPSRLLRVGVQLAFAAATTAALGVLVTAAVGWPLLVVTVVPWLVGTPVLGIVTACRKAPASRP